MSDTASNDSGAMQPGSGQGKIILAVSVLTNVVALWTCIMRVFVNRVDKRDPHWADRFIWLSMVLGSISNVFMIVEGVNWNKPSAALQADFFAQPWLVLSATFAKVAICILLVPLLEADIMRCVLEIQIMVFCVVNFGFIAASLFQCQPIGRFWSPTYDGQCWALHTRHSIEYVQAIIDLFSQLYMAFIALVVLHQHQATTRRGLKWGFGCLSVANLIIAVMVMLKMYFISLIDHASKYIPQPAGTILTVLVQNFLIMAANILPITMFFLKDSRPLNQMLRGQPIHTRQQMHPESGYLVHLDAASMLSKGDGTIGSSYSMDQSLRRRGTGSQVFIQTALGPPQEMWREPAHVKLDGVLLSPTNSVMSRTVVCKAMTGESSMSPVMMSPQGRDR